MLFNSYQFLLVFLPAAILIYWFADRSDRARNWTLIALSLAFYGYWDVRLLPLMIASILVNWWVAWLYAASRQRIFITVAIVANLLVLAVFKYANFFAESLSGLLDIPSTPLDLVLPLGISFFTFHHIMYLVDLGRGKATTYPLDRYALYICFFPQVLSGPLVRWSEVMHQFGRKTFVPGHARRCVFGLTLITLGLVQKVYLGDRLASQVNRVYEKIAEGAITASEAWVAVLGFTFQIFFDFSGYTDIAIGTALIFGIVLPLNFDSPYRAASIRDFWRRWHMTLSRFLRDYLYIPLGGNRFGLPHQVMALLVTMTLGGLWHGAGWTFVIWGLLHGIALTAVHLWTRFLPPLPLLLGWALTFVFVVATWVFFRAPTFDVAWRMFGSLLGDPQFTTERGWRTIGVAAFCAIVLPASYRIAQWLTKRPSYVVALVLGVAGAAILFELGQEKAYEFIYFRF
ncbi:MAG: MBOAT family O-acyltransferase [Xanthobacteraceae bacterium]